LLSQIAAAGKDGIFQGELVRVTGQDKRSVPKRTDGLRDKGYIIKEIVYRKGMKTSRLTLRKRVADEEEMSASPAAGTRPQPQNTQKQRTVRLAMEEIASLLAGENLLALDEVFNLTHMTSKAERKALTKLVRTMERAGCLKRVRMAFGPSAQSDDLRTYLQFIRAPIASDSEAFSNSGHPFDKPFADLMTGPSPVSPDLTSGSPDEGSETAQWNPDRCITNVLSEAVRMASTEGLSNVVSSYLSLGSRLSLI
jgi:hypothetical protein